MSLIISTKAELIKTKRTASFWLSVVGAAFVPTLLFIALLTDSGAAGSLAIDPWSKFFSMGWQILSVFFLPMYIILTSTLITQIEFKNNTIKQVFASPQSVSNIFFSKFLTIHLMILFSFVLVNIFMILAAVLGNIIVSEYTFLANSIDIEFMIKLNFKTYIAISGISAIQYWLSLRFKNFIVPVGMGLAFVIGSIIALNYHWEHIQRYPYALPALSFDFIQKPGRPLIENHEWNSIGCFVFFLLIGFWDMKRQNEHG